MTPGTIQLSQFQRKAAAVAMTDDITLTVVRPDPLLSVSSIVFLADLMTRGRPTAAVPIDTPRYIPQLCACVRAEVCV